jgi:hypothetical protein
MLSRDNPLVSGQQKYTKGTARVKQEAKTKYVPYPMLDIMYGTDRAITKFISQCTATQMATARLRMRSLINQLAKILDKHIADSRENLAAIDPRNTSPREAECHGIYVYHGCGNVASGSDGRFRRWCSDLDVCADVPHAECLDAESDRV